MINPILVILNNWDFTQIFICGTIILAIVISLNTLYKIYLNGFAFMDCILLLISLIYLGYIYNVGLENFKFYLQSFLMSIPQF